MLTRIVWVMSYNTALRLSIARRGFHPRRPMAAPRSGRHRDFMCGMRGIVTLAAAIRTAGSFPHRDLILLTAFPWCWLAGDPGLTLRPLISALHLRDENPVEREVSRARAVAYRPRSMRSMAIHRKKLNSQLEYRALLLRAETDPHGAFLPANFRHPLRRRAIAAARRAILALRQSETIGDDAFHMLEEELDWAS